MRVLIADDDEESILYLSKGLTSHGHSIVSCLNGREALSILLSSQPPDIALIDWVMPEMTGPEVSEKFRQTPTMNQPYLILLTARDEKEDILAGLRSGANDYITKPIKFNELASRLTVAKKNIFLGRLS